MTLVGARYGVYQRRVRPSALLAALGTALGWAGQQVSAQQMDVRDVGFNYLHETMFNPWAVKDPATFLPKSDAQRAQDFRLMRQVGATAVRIHGANQEWVYRAVEQAQNAGLRVWLSYRPTAKELVGEQATHPDEQFCQDKAKLRRLRGQFVVQFQAFVDTLASKNLLRPNQDCLVVANELSIDLAYRYDTEVSPSLGDVLLAQLAYAQAELPDIELTYAALSDESEWNRMGDWSQLHAAGLMFVSVNAYWSSVRLTNVLVDLQSASGLTLAVTETGALACSNAKRYGGDGAQVDVRKLGGPNGYCAGEATQQRGILELICELRDLELRGCFFFTWDDVPDTAFGLVRTNCIPADWNTKPYPDGSEWSQGCVVRQWNCVPVGKAAMNAVHGYLCPHSPSLTQVAVRNKEPGLKYVGLWWNPGPATGTGQPPAEYDPLESNEATTPGWGSLLLYNLKIVTGDKNPMDDGKVIWGKPGPGETDLHQFWCVDDPSHYWIRAYWESGERETGWIRLNLADETQAPQVNSTRGWARRYDPARNFLEVTFGNPEQAQADGVLDVVFCIDQSGSMMDDIQAVQSVANETLTELGDYARTSNISLQTGLVVYTRHDEPNWLQAQPLTSDLGTLGSLLQQINITNPAVGKGGNEDMHGALMYAMNQTVGGQSLIQNPNDPNDRGMGWRPGAAKICIPIGDEPPDDPDWEHRTLDDVTTTADRLDPVHMYPLILPKQGSTYSDPAVVAMRRLADATGGQITRVKDAASLPAALVATIRLAVDRHRTEVWRKDNPPYTLYGTLGGIAALVLLGATVAVWQQARRRGAAASLRATGAAAGRLDPTLTGESDARGPRR